MYFCCRIKLYYTPKTLVRLLMMRIRKVHFFLSGGSLLLAMLPCAAGAYGPEGMFGGRLSPDSTYNTNIPMTTETSPGRGESVLDHPRPDYDPLPISAGSFNIYPSLEASGTYDTNVFATANDTKSDTVYEIRPAVVANSNWNRNALSIMSFGDLNYYNEHTEENFQDAVFLAQGRIDIQQGSWIAIRAGYQHLITPPGSPDNVNGSGPTPFEVYSTGATFYRGVGIINTQLDYDFKRYDYGNTPASAGEIDTSINTRNEQVVKAKIGYDHSGNLKPYIQAAYNWRGYDNDPTRSSHGYQLDAGVDADLGGIVFLNAYAGWLSQDYYNFGASEINDGVDFGGRLMWNVTGLTTMIIEGNRSIEENPFSSFNSFMATGGSLTLTHELLRNLLVEADLSYTHDAFQGTASQTQNFPSAGGGLRWLINQYFYTDLVYNYQEQTPDGYMRNLISLRLNMRL